MKLTLNRQEKSKKGLLGTKTKYSLDVAIEVTPEEMKLLEKHKWKMTVLCDGLSKVEYFGDGLMSGLGADNSNSLYLSIVIEKPKELIFDSIQRLAFVENKIIESAKLVKTNLGAAAGFTSGGPREIEL